MRIAIANQKGGVGKTTTAAALGAAWADTGRRVLWVDMDPQASLTTAVGAEPSSTFYQALSALVLSQDTPAIIARAVQHLPTGEDLLPSHLDLAAAEVDWVGAMHREHLLSELLGQLPRLYDVTVIDTPPTLGLLTINALTAADVVLVPVTPEYLAVQGLERLVHTVSLVRKRLNRKLTIAGVIPTMVKGQTRHHQAMLEQVGAFCDEHGLALWPSIGDTIKAADASGQGVPLTRFAGTNGVGIAYRSIAQDLMGVMHG